MFIIIVLGVTGLNSVTSLDGQFHMYFVYFQNTVFVFKHILLYFCPPLGGSDLEVFSGLNIYCYYSPICTFEEITMRSVRIVFILMSLYM